MIQVLKLNLSYRSHQRGPVGLNVAVLVNAVSEFLKSRGSVSLIAFGSLATLTFKMPIFVAALKSLRPNENTQKALSLEGTVHVFITFRMAMFPSRCARLHSYHFLVCQMGA